MITLTKDKIIYSTNYYKNTSEKYKKYEVKRLLPYLNEPVELSGDFTLGDLFGYIEKEKKLFDVLFSSQLGWNNLQAFIDEINLPLPKEKNEEIEFLEIKRWAEYFDGGIDLWIDFSGIGKEGSYALEFTPLNEIKHLPLCLNTEFKVTKLDVPFRIICFLIRNLYRLNLFSLAEKLNDWSCVYVKGKTYFTVYELIETILDEVSFVGTLEEKTEMLEKLEKEIEEMKNELERKKK